MAKFLTLKHWQLFVLLLGLPIILEFITIDSFLSRKNTSLLFSLFPVMMILFLGLFFCWFYALGTNLHKKLPPTVSMNLTRFKIFLFIPALYMLVILIFVALKFSDPLAGGQISQSTFAFILPLHIFSMFCIFFCLFFNAKAMKSVEWQRPVTFSDFAGEFFLIWFFPIGIWIIQPRINKLFDPALANHDLEIFGDNVSS